MSTSSSECQLSPLPRYTDHAEVRRKCTSLNHGVLPPWHNPDFDSDDDPAYAVVNLVHGNQMRPSRSFCHNRPERVTDRVSSKSLREAVLRKDLNLTTDRPVSIHGVPLRKNPNRSERPVSVQYNGPDRPISVHFTGPGNLASYPKYEYHSEAGYDNYRRQPNEAGYDNYRKPPRKPARLPHELHDDSGYDNFRSSTALGMHTSPDIQIPPKDDTSKEMYNDLERGQDFSHSETNIAMNQDFSADQPLPKTPYSPNSSDNSVFAYPRGERRRLSSEHVERRLSGEVDGDDELRHRSVHRQRSFSDSFTKPLCALDAITESFSFTVGSDQISSTSSSEETLHSAYDSPSPRLSPIIPARHKVLVRQKQNVLDNTVRPTSEPVREVEYAKVMKSRLYPRLNSQHSSNEVLDDGEQVDPGLESFPPYRIHSVSGGTDM